MGREGGISLARGRVAPPIRPPAPAQPSPAQPLLRSRELLTDEGAVRPLTERLRGPAQSCQGVFTSLPTPQGNLVPKSLCRGTLV